MKRALATALLFTAALAAGQASAQTAPKEAYAGFDLGSGVSVWTGVSGKGGYGQMSFNPGQDPIVSSFAVNKSGSVSVYAAPWANGSVKSEDGGSASTAAFFKGNGNAVSQITKDGANTSTSISKSVTLWANSSGKGSASVSGGFDASVNANAFAPTKIIPIFIFVKPTSPSLPAKGGKG